MRCLISDLAHDIEAGTCGISTSQNVEMGVNITSCVLDKSYYNGSRTQRAGHYHAIDHIDTIDERRLVQATARCITGYLHDRHHILIAGFGNSNYMCDRLGPSTISHIDVGKFTNSNVYTFLPSVKSITGISSIALLKAICMNFDIDTVIAIDTLATSNLSRLGTSIQITDAGINPGGGVGNSQGHIALDSIGVQVIGVGIPLVISYHSIGYNNSGYLAPSLIDDIVDKYSKVLAQSITRAILSI